MTWKGKGDGRKGGGGKTIHWNEGGAIGDMDWEVPSKSSNKILVKIRNRLFTTQHFDQYSLIIFRRMLGPLF